MRLLPLLGLLVWGCAAHADGTWIRWAQVTTSDGVLVEWKARKFYPTKADCERELTAKRVEKCLPDTDDPKEKSCPTNCTLTRGVCLCPSP